MLLANRTEEAVEVYRSLLRQQPNDAEVHYHLGLALSRLGRSGEALDSFDAALRLKPDHAKARAFRAQLLAKLGRSDPPP